MWQILRKYEDFLMIVKESDEIYSSMSAIVSF